MKLNKFSILNIGKNPAQDKKTLFLTVLVCLIVGYLDFAFIVKLQLAGIKNLESKSVKLKKDLDTAAKDILHMQDLKNKQLERKDKALQEEKKIISEEYAASLLQDVSDLANKDGVKIIQMKPLKEPQTPKQEKASHSEKFTSLLISLELLCDYHRLGRFINDLENAQTLIAVKNIKITAHPTDQLRQNVDLVLKTYVRK